MHLRKTRACAPRGGQAKCDQVWQSSSWSLEGGQKPGSNCTDWQTEMVMGKRKGLFQAEKSTSKDAELRRLLCTKGTLPSSKAVILKWLHGDSWVCDDASETKGREASGITGAPYQPHKIFLQWTPPVKNKIWSISLSNIQGILYCF